MKKRLLLFCIPVLFNPGKVKFKETNHLESKFVLDQVRFAFPHANCTFDQTDSVYTVDNFVNFDVTYFVNRMQQQGVVVNVLNAHTFSK